MQRLCKMTNHCVPAKTDARFNFFTWRPLCLHPRWANMSHSNEWQGCDFPSSAVVCRHMALPDKDLLWLYELWLQSKGGRSVTVTMSQNFSGRVRMVGKCCPTTSETKSVYSCSKWPHSKWKAGHHRETQNAIITHIFWQSFLEGIHSVALLTSTQVVNHSMRREWMLDCRLQKITQILSHPPIWHLNSDFKGSLTSTKSFSCLNLTLTWETSFYISFLLPLLPGWTEASAECCGVLCEQWWWILYRGLLPLRGVNEEDSQHQSHSLVFLEILHNPIWS